MPNHPGFGVPERPQWMRHPRDIASIYQWLLAELGIERASLVGLGFGGWIAAEMCALAPRDFHRLVLVGAMGVKPPEGDILDQAIISYIDYARAGFHSEAAFARVFGDASMDQLVAWGSVPQSASASPGSPTCTARRCRTLGGCAPGAGGMGRRRQDRAEGRRALRKSLR